MCFFPWTAPSHLEQVLREAISQGQARTHRPWKKIIVVIEGIYSMEGELCRLKDIVEVAKKYKVPLWCFQLACFLCPSTVIVSTFFAPWNVHFFYSRKMLSIVIICTSILIRGSDSKTVQVYHFRIFNFRTFISVINPVTCGIVLGLVALAKGLRYLCRLTYISMKHTALEQLGKPERAYVSCRV